MKPKLILIVLGLVVIPTAVLSFLANRALGSREDLLQYRLKTDAASAIQVVSRRVQSRFEDDMDHVRAVVSECLARGGKNADLEAAANRLRNSRGTVSRVFVFMNPWGFIFPSFSASSSDSARDNSLDSLVSALRREIPQIGSATNTIRLTVEDATYWFSSISGRKETYAGFEVNQNEFAEQLQNALTTASGEIFVLVAEGPGIGRTNDVMISDVFGERTESRCQRSDLASDPLASGRLMKPFDYVSIKAFVVDPGKIRKAAELRDRLYAWGIVLAAAGVCLGIWLVLREAAAEIKRARTRSDFVIGVSHDLRTPVASMKMLAESLYLERVGSQEQRKKFLQVIVRESERLGQLIERVLFFVRMDQDALIYRFGRVDVGGIVSSAVSAFKARTEAGGEKPASGNQQPVAGSITLSVAPGIPPIQADDSAIAQVVLNLLDNAVKYGRGDCGKADHGEATTTGLQQPESARNTALALSPQITVSVSSVEDSFRHLGFMPRRQWVAISVHDNGAGIDRKQQRKIFRRFYRVPGTGDSNISGVGLGLALCRHVAKSHGGWIEVDSQPGKGSTFSVYLPVRVQARPTMH